MVKKSQKPDSIQRMSAFGTLFHLPSFYFLSPASFAICILPSCIFVTALAYIYMKYRKMSMLQGILGSLRPAVVAMIAKAGVTILISAVFLSGAVEVALDNISVRAILWFAAALVLLRKKKMNPIMVMVLCGVMETICVLVMKWI